MIAACAASAGAHAALAPEHLREETSLGIAFAVAAVVLAVAAVALALRPEHAAGARLAALALAALIAGYALSVLTGIPGLVDEPEPVDPFALATKAVEAIGLVYALSLASTHHRPIWEEIRP